MNEFEGDFVKLFDALHDVWTRYSGCRGVSITRDFAEEDRDDDIQKLLKKTKSTRDSIIHRNNEKVQEKRDREEYDRLKKKYEPHTFLEPSRDTGDGRFDV